jgi:hypothetical protein
MIHQLELRWRLTAIGLGRRCCCRIGGPNIGINDGIDNISFSSRSCWLLNAANLTVLQLLLDLDELNLIF